jgi:protein TonB
MTHSLPRSVSPRDRTGLAITIALHAGIVGVGLLAVTTARIAAPPKAIITRHVPEPPRPVPAPAAPMPYDIPVPVAVPLPDILVEIPHVVEAPPVTAIEPPILPIDPGIGATLQPPALGPTRIARFDQRYASAAQPPYPEASRRMSEEGTVVVHVRIGRDGRVLAATLAQSSGVPRLDAAALRHALAMWRFIPALEAGTPVESTRDIKVDFRLANAAA